MSPRKYTKDYFDDNAEIAKIKTGFWEFIEKMDNLPYYHVLLLALQGLITDVVKLYVKDGEVMRRWHGDK